MDTEGLRSIEDMPEEELTRSLAYAGLVLVAFELVKSMIVEPIKFFYADTTHGESMPFKTYDEDVRSRHRNEFEACLLYLRDFMEAIDSSEMLIIQSLRKHRNELAHDLADRLPNLRLAEHRALFERVDRVLFKLSNYRLRMEIGAEPELRDVDWDSAKGHEYLLFEHVVEKVKLLSQDANGPGR